MTSIGSRSRYRSWLLVLIAVVVAACGDDGTADPTESGGGDAPLVVVTTSILGDVVSSIVGDDATVEVLMPPGSDPHDFEPSARQAARLRDADLVVANGFGLEIGLAGALDSASDDGARVIEVGRFVEPLPFGEVPHDDDGHDADDHDGHDEDHEDGDVDPHYWHDPIRMSDAMVPLARAIAEEIPELDDGRLRSSAQELVEELRTTDEEIAGLLESIPGDRRFILTNHDTFGYLADRYDFEVIGTIIPGGDTLASPSSGDLAWLVGQIEEHDLRAIFAESITSSALADTLASEVGFEVAVVPLYTDALGPPGSGAETYRGMLLTNAELIAGALS